MYKNGNKREYIYDPQHQLHPGGGYIQTQKGWTLKQEQTRKIDLTKEDKSNGIHIHQKQLKDSDIVTFMDMNGNIKKSTIKDLSKQQRIQIVKQIKLSGFIHAEGFGDYTQVNLSSFNKNKQNILRFLQDKNIPQRKNQRQTYVSKRIEGFLEQQKQNLNMIIQKYGKALVNPYSKKAVNNYLDTLSEVIKQACRQGGGLQKISQKDLDEYLQQDMKRLIYQQVQSRGRSLGDHGVRHLVGNAINSVKILNELQKGGIGQRKLDGTLNGHKITGKDKLMAMSTMINHDIGYTLGQVALNAAKGGYHKSYSGLIAFEQSDRYKKIFGEDGKQLMVGEVQVYDNGKPVLYNKDGQRLEQNKVYNKEGKMILSQQEYQDCKIRHLKGKQGMIQYHDSSNYDWKNDPIRSSVSLSDCTSLFGQDKVQELFYHNDQSMKQITKIQMILNSDVDDQIKKKAFNGFKKNIHNHIQRLQNATIMDKDLLHSQIQQFTIQGFNTIDDVLSRSSGKLTGYEYDNKNNTVIVNTEYSEQGNMLQNIFGDKISRLQWNKLYKDIKDSGKIYINQKGQQTLYLGDQKDQNSSRIKVNINGFVGNSFGSKGISEAYLNVKSYPFKKQIARLSQSLSQLKNVGQNISITQPFKRLNKLKSRLQEKAGIQMVKGQIIFGDAYEKVKQLLQMATKGIDISDKLKSLGLTEQQKAYLLGGFIKKSSVNKLAYKIAKEQFINKLSMRLAMEQIKKYQKVIGEIIIRYQSDGQLKFMIDKHMYKCVKYYRMNFVNEFLKEHYKELKKIKNQKDLKQFLQSCNVSYRRLFQYEYNKNSDDYSC